MNEQALKNHLKKILSGEDIILGITAGFKKVYRRTENGEIEYTLKHIGDHEQFITWEDFKARYQFELDNTTDNIHQFVQAILSHDDGTYDGTIHDSGHKQFFQKWRERLTQVGEIDEDAIDYKDLVV
ncbi:MAG: hypothetical protein QXQ02_03130 [Halobacteria archaeon]